LSILHLRPNPFAHILKPSPSSGYPHCRLNLRILVSENSPPLGILILISVNRPSPGFPYPHLGELALTLISSSSASGDLIFSSSPPSSLLASLRVDTSPWPTQLEFLGSSILCLCRDRVGPRCWLGTNVDDNSSLLLLCVGVGVTALSLHIVLAVAPPCRCGCRRCLCSCRRRHSQSAVQGWCWLGLRESVGVEGSSAPWLSCLGCTEVECSPLLTLVGFLLS
jgi:hypothetical protein